MRKLWCPLALSLLVVGSIQAQGWNIEMLDTKYTNWHDAEVIAQQGSYVYLGLEYTTTAGGGMAVVDVTDPENPMEVSYCETIDDINCIELDGDYSYIGYWGEGLLVLDVSNPFNPIEIACYPEPASIHNVIVVENLAYITSMSGGFTIADISDPANIVYLSENSFGEGGQSLFVVDNIAYMSGSNMMRIIDVSDPSNPIIVSNFGLPETPDDFYKDGDLLYVALWLDGLYIYDISDPVNPLQIGNSTTSAISVIVSDGIAYTRSMGNVLTNIDVSNPAHPFFLGSLQTNHSINDYILVDDYILTAYEYYGLKPFNVSDPSNIIALPAYEPDWWINGVELSGNYAYVTDKEAGLMVLDVSDPANMIQVAFINSIESIYGIEIAGEYAFIGGWDDELYVVAINDPTNPRIEGQTVLNGRMNYIDEASSLMYVSNNEGMLTIYDITIATNPQIIGSYRFFPGGAYDEAWLYDIDVEENMMYGIAYYYEIGEGGPLGDSLLVLDVADPANPDFVSMTNLDISASQIEVRDELAFIGASIPSLVILDISDPTRPELISDIDFPGTVENMVLKYEYLYLQSSYGTEIGILDISDPADPRLSGYYNTPDNAYDIAVGDELIFVADHDYFESYTCDQAVWVNPQTHYEHPKSFVLNHVYPNPFNHQATISFDLPVAGDISLKVFDITGREVTTLVNGQSSPGQHEVVWDAERVASGVYFVRLEAGKFAQTRKILLVK